MATPQDSARDRAPVAAVHSEKDAQTTGDAIVSSNANGHIGEPQQPALNEKDTTQESPKDAQPKSGEQDEKKEDKSKDQKKEDKSKDEKQPEGGFDSTPIPRRPAGYTVKFTFHRALNLPIGDINSMASDPFVLALLSTDVPTRHKEDPPLRHRTHTIQKTREPVWDDEWIVANVPASGFKLKLHIYDEDAADKDDLLGGVHITVPTLDENWPGIKDKMYKLKLHGGSYRAYFLQAVTTCFRKNKQFRGEVFLSIEVLGRTDEDGQNGRLYTVGPCRWIRHYSPLLGRLVNIKEPDSRGVSETPSVGARRQVEQYNFQANQMQLHGPVPAELYHRFVEFKPWVKRMFTSSGLSGILLGKALHHQHTRVYNFGRSTETGKFEKPCEEMTQKFLDLVHYDEGGRIFTYVLTLDALWRFTETGKEFGIDMLSKHTMHSDVSIYIAFSGEFFIRRLKHPKQPPPPAPAESASQAHPPSHEPNPSHPPKDVEGGPPDDEPPRDPRYYELVIDNDSGTYRPNAEMLPLLQAFLAQALPGLHILTLDCQADAELMGRMKDQQRQRKKAEGKHVVYTQAHIGSSASSISSSDEEDLDVIQASLEAQDGSAAEHGAIGQFAREAKIKQKAKLGRVAREYGLKTDGTNNATIPVESESTSTVPAGEPAAEEAQKK